jgi:hypothetical protein
VTDYAGPLQRLDLSRTLWTIGAPPLVAFVWLVLRGRRQATRARNARDVERAAAGARGVGLMSLFPATAATVLSEVIAARAPAGGRALFEPLIRCVRIGQLDVGIDLWFDRLSAASCCMVCVIALGTSRFLSGLAPARQAWRAWAWLELTVAGALLASLADGFVTMAMGWTLVAVGGTWLASWTDGRTAAVTATRAAAGIAALMVAASLLFWALGGAWQDNEYVPNLRPRFAAVRDEKGTTPPRQVRGGDTDEAAPGSLTMTSVPGATVFVDDARSAAALAPFVRTQLSAGSHVLRIHAGGLTEDAIVGPFTIALGDAIALVQIGPSLSFREIAAELMVRDGSGNEPEAGRALAQRSSPLGASVVATVLVILFLGAGAMSATSPPTDVPPTLRLASRFTGIVLALLLLARVEFLLHFVHERAAVATAALVVSIAVVAAGVSRRRPGLHEVVFAKVPERLGVLVVSFDRWVIEAVAGALAGGARIAAWVAAWLDVDAIGAPADAAAARVVRVGHAAEAVIGQPLGRVAWTLLAVLATAAIAHAAWPVR